MGHSKHTSKMKGRDAAALGAVGVSLSLVGGATSVGAPLGVDLPAPAVSPPHAVILGEEEIADVSLTTFYVFDKENARPSRRSERLACGCWTGTYYTSGNDAYPTPLRPVRQQHGHVPKHVPKSLRQ